MTRRIPQPIKQSCRRKQIGPGLNGSLCSIQVILMQSGDTRRQRGNFYLAAPHTAQAAGQTPLQRAINLAARLRDFKQDDAAAAKALDIALARKPDQASPDYARALADRLELAIALDDGERAQALRAELERLEQR